MIRHGARPTKKDHRDFDYHRTFGSPTSFKFPDTYLCDAGLTMPNQNARDDQFTPAVPAMPYGCTDEAQADLATDLSGIVHNPSDLEAVTGANAKGGYDVRQSLLAAKRLGWITGFFTVTTHGQLDSFDTLRLAQVSGIPEKRSITWGTPWFSSWEEAAQRGQSLMPMPTTAELIQVATKPASLPWHDSVLDGWLPLSGRTVYRDKSWQGNAVGDHGFLYFPREVINVVSGINGVAAFTATRGEVPPITTIPVTLWQWLMSNLRILLKLQY